MTLLADSAVAAEFPLLRETGLAYLDSAATAQKPRAVIEAVEDFTARHNASVHRGVYPLAAEASARYEAARERIAAFTGSAARETVFTKNATEALNLVMYSWGRAHVRAGDAIVLTRLEHHSNLVPWQMLCAEVGAELRYVDPDANGHLDLAQLDAHLADGRVRLVAATHVSNVTGTITPVAEITALEPAVEKLSDEALRAKTSEFRERLAAGDNLEGLMKEAFAVAREAGAPSPPRRPTKRGRRRSR